VHIVISAIAKGLHSNACAGFEGSGKTLKERDLHFHVVGLQIALDYLTQ
jgi:hypothetical protein